MSRLMSAGCGAVRDSVKPRNPEVGASEALLMRHHVRTLLLYLGTRCATKTVDAMETFFATKVADPYRWLEDERSPEVQAWVKAQDELARKELAKLPKRAEFAEKLAAHFNGKLGQTLIRHRDLSSRRHE